MDFEDEDYVRCYTRDTATWKLLGWKGQTVLLHMLRNGFDRAGRFAASRSVTERHGLSRAVTAVTGLPKEVVEEGLRAVLDEGIWLVTENGLVWPRYVHAQTCARTDRARKRLERERRAAVEAATSPSRSVTGSHDPSQAVTKCHSEAEAEAEAEAEPPIVPQGGTGETPPQLPLVPDQPPPPDPVREVFDHWAAVAWPKVHEGGRAPMASDERLRPIRARLADGYTVAQLRAVVDRVSADPFYLGQNERRTPYIEPKTIMRNASKVDELLATAAGGSSGATSRGPTGLEDTEQW